MVRTACTEPQYLYSTATPLVPLWAVLPVQSLSACTVQLYLYSPYWPYCLYRASVPVQYNYTSTPPMDRTACTEPQCLYSTAIPLLPLWAVQSVQSLSACKRVHFTFYIHNLARVYKLARVPRWQNAKLKLNFYYISSKDSSHILPFAKFAVIAAIFTKIQFLWDVTTDRRVGGYRRCEGSRCLTLQGQPV
jgi:hypothetical protein